MKCEGFVPESVEQCPHCRASRAWWMVPLGVVGAGVAAVTLSACYGPACAVRYADGGKSYPDSTCVGFDCTVPLADGGKPEDNAEWLHNCEPEKCRWVDGDGGCHPDDRADGGT